MPRPLLTFVHISDTHIHPDPTYSKDYAEVTSYAGAQALVEQVNALPFDPEFVLHTGDVAYDPYPEAYNACRDILGEIKYPVYYLAGNHDKSIALQKNLMAHGDPINPLHYVFEHNGVQIVCLDSNDKRAEPPRGYVSDYQIGWLAGLCQAKDDRPMVIAVHHNPTLTGIRWLDSYMGIQNTEQFHQALLPARDRIRGVFFGHVHQNLDIYRDGILYCSTLSSWTQFHAWPGMVDTQSDKGAEPGFSVVSIYEDQTIIRRYRFKLPQ